MHVAIPFTLKSHEVLDKAVFYLFIFGIFINDLLIDLSTSDHGLRVGSNKFESFAYADDIKLFIAAVPGFQKMIDKFLIYSNTLRFKFGINPLGAKLLNWNSHPLEVVTRWRDPQLQGSENYSDLTKWRSTNFKSCWIMSLLFFTRFKSWYVIC